MRTIDEAKRGLLFQSAISDYYFGLENGIYKPTDVCRVVESFIEIRNGSINIYSKFPLKTLKISVDSKKKLHYKNYSKNLRSNETLVGRESILNQSFYGIESFWFSVDICDDFQYHKIFYKYDLLDKINKVINSNDSQVNLENVQGVSQNVKTTYNVSISSQGEEKIDLPDGIYLVNHIYMIDRIPITRIYECKFIGKDIDTPFSVSDIIFYPESVLDHDSEDEYFKLRFDSRNIKMRKDYEHVCTTEFSSFELIDEMGYYSSLSELIDGIEEE